MTILVMLSCLLKMSGISSTPTWSDFAWINGALLNFGSSAMESWSALTLPEKTPRLKLPTLTGRPSAVLRVDSICGRKLLTFTSNGSAMAMTINTATTMPATLRAVFTTYLLKAGPDAEGDRWRLSQSIKTAVVGRWSLVVGRSRPLVLSMTDDCRLAT